MSLWRWHFVLFVLTFVLFTAHFYPYTRVIVTDDLNQRSFCESALESERMNDMYGMQRGRKHRLGRRLLINLTLAAVFVGSIALGIVGLQLQQTHAASGSHKGIQFGAPVSQAADGVVHQMIGDQQITQMKNSGATWVRLDFITDAFQHCVADPACQSDAGQSFFSVYDPIVQRIQNAGLQIVGVMGPGFITANQDAWNDNNVENGGSNGDNTHVHQFAAQARLLAAHYSSITYWEVWNEPDGSTSCTGNFSGTLNYQCSGGTFIYPSNFAQLIHLTSQVIHKANPVAKVISGGILSQNNDNHDDDSIGYTYMHNVYHFGPTARWSGAPFDYLGYHLYICQTSSTCPDTAAASSM